MVRKNERVVKLKPAKGVNRMVGVEWKYAPAARGQAKMRLSYFISAPGDARPCRE